MCPIEYPEVTPAMMQEYDRQINGILTPPATARVKMLEDRNTGEMKEHRRWNESMRVSDVTVKETTSQSGNDHILFSVEFEITASRGSGTLVGSKTYFVGRFNPIAYKANNREDGQWKMSNGTLVRLTQLVRACGFPVKGGLSSAQIQAYFPESGQSPLINREINGSIHQTSSAQAASGWNEEVESFFPLAGMAPNAEV